jgi:hypothetical protein
MIISTPDHRWSCFLLHCRRPSAKRAVRLLQRARELRRLMMKMLHRQQGVACA